MSQPTKKGNLSKTTSNKSSSVPIGDSPCITSGTHRKSKKGAEYCLNPSCVFSVKKKTTRRKGENWTEILINHYNTSSISCIDFIPRCKCGKKFASNSCLDRHLNHYKFSQDHIAVSVTQYKDDFRLINPSGPRTNSQKLSSLPETITGGRSINAPHHALTSLTRTGNIVKA